jgi:hypothetical protein
MNFERPPFPATASIRSSKSSAARKVTIPDTAALHFVLQTLPIHPKSRNALQTMYYKKNNQSPFLYEKNPKPNKCITSKTPVKWETTVSGKE